MEVTESPTFPTSNKIIRYAPLILLAVFVVLFLPTFQGLYSRWIKWDEGLSHGLLVNGIYVYLLYKSLPWKKHEQSKILTLFCYASLALASLCWFVFHLSNIYIFEQLLLLVLLIGLYGCCYGVTTLFQHRLLLLLPIFAIPIWEQLTDVLVNLSGFAVGEMVRAVGIPAIIEGNSIFIPAGHIVIADGCSGLRYFEIALTLGFIIGLLNDYREKHLVPTLIIAAALGLLANWIRIFILVVVGYQTKMQSSLMSNHEFFGWILFGLMCLPAIYFAPVLKKKKTQPNQINNNLRPTFILPIVILAIGPFLNLLINSSPKHIEFTNLLTTKAQYSALSQLPVTVTAPENSFEEKGLLTTDKTTIYIEINQYQRNKPEDKLVPYIARLYNNEQWLADTSTLSLNGHTANLTKFRQKTSSRTVMQLQWFDVGGHKTHSLAMAKILQIPALIRGINSFKIVTLQSQCDNENCEHAQASLTSNFSQIFANTQDY